MHIHTYTDARTHIDVCIYIYLYIYRSFYAQFTRIDFITPFYYHGMRDDHARSKKAGKEDEEEIRAGVIRTNKRRTKERTNERRTTIERTIERIIERTVGSIAVCLVSYCKMNKGIHNGNGKNTNFSSSSSSSFSSSSSR